MRSVHLIESIVVLSHYFFIHGWHCLALTGSCRGDLVDKLDPFILVNDMILVDVTIFKNLLNDGPEILIASGPLMHLLVLFLQVLIYVPLSQGVLHILYEIIIFPVKVLIGCEWILITILALHLHGL